eukprot:349651-Chlamydomonas_euryale.AAC.4
MSSAALTTYYNILADGLITHVPTTTNGPFSNFLSLQWAPRFGEERPGYMPELGMTQQVGCAAVLGGWAMDSYDMSRETGRFVRRADS